MDLTNLIPEARYANSIRIGSFLDLLGNEHPAYLSLDASPNVCFLSDECHHEETTAILQSYVLTILNTLPPHICKITLFDSEGIGGNLGALPRLNNNIVETGICTNYNDFHSLLNSLVNLISEVTRGIRKVDTLNFLILAHMPADISVHDITSLIQVMKNGRRAGIFTCMSFFVDSSFDHFKVFKEFTKLSTFIYRSISRFYIKNIQIGSEEFSTIFQHMALQPTIYSYSESEEIVKTLNSRYVRKKTVELMKHSPERNHWWKSSSVPKIDIPFGLKEPRRTEETYLSLTQQDGRHSAIVVGVPGSGKSAFLHTLILSAAMKYSPEELQLYLIDFSGVSFTIYAENALPHAKVIVDECDQEFGVNVLRAVRKEKERRTALFNEVATENINQYRAKTGKKLPRILLIIDEFQVLFSDEMGEISMYAQQYFQEIIREYRKFGINMILATQHIHDCANKISFGDIANRVIFRYNENDRYLLFTNGTTQYPVPSESGQCLNVAGPSTELAKTYFAGEFNEDGSEDMRVTLLGQLASLAKERNIKLDQYVFRSKSEIYFEDNTSIQGIKKTRIPDLCKVYLGEMLAISDSHAYLELDSTTGSNILVIGGRQEVSRGVAANCLKSLVAAHLDKAATFEVFNFIPLRDETYLMPRKIMTEAKQNDDFVEHDRILEVMNSVKVEIENRRTNSLKERSHIYLIFFDFQNAGFESNDQWGALSEGASLLSDILQNGPRLGIFTILQVDTLQNLSSQLPRGSQHFNHRIVLQMSEDDSRAIMNSNRASKLFRVDKPYTAYRAYYYNQYNEHTLKFKPYQTYDKNGY